MTDNLTVKDVKRWLDTTPDALNKGRIVRTKALHEAYLTWAESTGAIDWNMTAFGLAIRNLIPGIQARQIMRDRERFRVYILPPKLDPQDADDLL